MTFARRDALRTLAAAVAVPIAGCAAGERGTPPDPDATETDGTGTDATTTADATLVLEADSVPDDVPRTVYPANLQEWLRRAAEGDAPVRAHATVGVAAPEPALESRSAVRFEDPSGALEGAYRLDVEAGTRYELLLGADRVESPPPDASVTPTSSLSDARRTLARSAIRGDFDARVYPETRLGEWAREGFLGSYFEHEGTTYRGVERQQTDAAFFSEEVWYVVDVAPAATWGGGAGGDEEPTVLRLPEVDPVVRAVVDDALDRWRTGNSGVRIPVPAADRDAVDAFADATAALLTHAALARVRVVEGSG